MTSKLIEKLKAAGFEPCSYSGRGMMGKTCVSISGDLGNDEVRKAVGRKSFLAARRDSLGKGIVLYWPSEAWTAEDDKSEDE